jgi:hyperosmotically inducible periplasmic protein
MIGKASMGFLGMVGLMAGVAGPAAAQMEPPVVAQAEAQPAISDATITADIQARLNKLVLLRNAQVTIASTNGVVTLVGMVPSQTAHEQAIEVAHATPGVVRVDDMLRLDISSPQAPTRN